MHMPYASPATSATWPCVCHRNRTLPALAQHSAPHPLPYSPLRNIHSHNPLHPTPPHPTHKQPPHNKPRTKGQRGQQLSLGTCSR
jgi:hypothetical protein